MGFRISGFAASKMYIEGTFLAERFKYCAAEVRI